MKLSDLDYKLIEIAKNNLSINYDYPFRTVSTAIMTMSGKIITSLNLRFSGYGICAEGAAFASYLNMYEDQVIRVVTVGGEAPDWKILNPCGNCRQMIAELAPECKIIGRNGSELLLIDVMELLPYPHRNKNYLDTKFSRLKMNNLEGE